MKKLIIKVCGMREPKNIEALQQLDIDWMGMIFFEKSKRHVRKIPKLKMEKPRVGVFVNASIADILMKAKAFELSAIQLHGDETPEFCEKLSTRLAKSSRLCKSNFSPISKRLTKSSRLRKSEVAIIKVFSAHDDFNFETTTAYENHCDYFLFDTKGKERGGNGVAFNWQILENYKGKTPFILSGGIDENSAKKIKVLLLKHSKFAGVDINSKFEIRPAFKDIQKIKRFIHELRSEQ